MTVVHISYIYGEKNTGGAAIAATRLHKALLDGGYDSQYICIKQMEEGENVYVLPKGWRRKMFFFLTKVIRGFWKLTSYRKSISLNVVPLWGLEKLLRSLKPDLIHVQWLNADVVSYEQIARLPYSVIFNLHDLFIINALEPHPFSDQRFIEDFNKGNSSYLERYLFMRKKNMVEKLNASFIGPSYWVCNQCRTSIIGRNRSVTEVSNMVHPIFFNSDSTKKINNDKFVILFGAFGGRQNRYKGFDELTLALRLLPEKVKAQSILKIYGEVSESGYTEGVETMFLGQIDSPEKMVEVMNSSDVFAFPSRAETQGMTKVEALLCGVPVVAFDRTACSEGILHKGNGWIANDGDSASFAKGIEFFYDLWGKGRLISLGEIIRDSAIEQYSQQLIVSKVIDAYNKLITRK